MVDLISVPLSRDGGEVLALAGTWARYFSPVIGEAGASVLLLVGAESESSACGICRIEIEGASFSTALRSIPVMRIEAALNLPASQAARRAAGTATEAQEALRSMAYPDGVACEPIDLTIDDPGGYRKPNSFYRDLAARFLAVSAVSVRPAHEIAAANGVPLGTVHRWVREARRRGALVLPVHRQPASGEESEPERWR